MAQQSQKPQRSSSQDADTDFSSSQDQKTSKDSQQQWSDKKQMPKTGSNQQSGARPADAKMNK